MALAREPKPAKYCVGLLSSDNDLLSVAETDLSSILGEVDGRSETVPWTVSTFYEKEMGAGLRRRFLAFANLRAPDELAAVKVQTNLIEDNYRIGAAGQRRVNVDPGYLDAYKVVLASTKNAGQRIYLGSGIYGETTLVYHDGAFHGLAHTYQDYLWPETLAFLAHLRSVYLAQLRQHG